MSPGFVSPSLSELKKKRKIEENTTENSGTETPKPKSLLGKNLNIPLGAMSPGFSSPSLSELKKKRKIKEEEEENSSVSPESKRVKGTTPTKREQEQEVKDEDMEDYKPRVTPIKRMQPGKLQSLTKGRATMKNKRPPSRKSNKKDAESESDEENLFNSKKRPKGSVTPVKRKQEQSTDPSSSKPVEVDEEKTEEMGESVRDVNACIDDAVRELEARANLKVSFQIDWKSFEGMEDKDKAYKQLEMRTITDIMDAIFFSEGSFDNEREYTINIKRDMARDYQHLEFKMGDDGKVDKVLKYSHSFDEKDEEKLSEVALQFGTPNRKIKL